VEEGGRKERRGEKDAGHIDLRCPFANHLYAGPVDVRVGGGGRGRGGEGLFATIHPIHTCFLFADLDLARCTHRREKRGRKRGRGKKNVIFRFAVIEFMGHIAGVIGLSTQGSSSSLHKAVYGRCSACRITARGRGRGNGPGGVAFGRCRSKWLDDHVRCLGIS